MMNDNDNKKENQIIDPIAHYTAAEHLAQEARDQAETSNRLLEEAEKVADAAYAALTLNKKENQMIDPMTAARRDFDNADKAFNSNPTDANLASYEIARKAFLAAEAEAGLSSNAAVDDIDDDERPFPDSDEAIRALQDVAEAVDELEAECYRLRAELKTSNAERDELRRQVETIKNGFEGGCYLCEVVGEMNKKLLAERDEARREVCEFEKYCREEAIRRGWDCFKETP